MKHPHLPLLPVLLLALVLTACGGGGSPAATPEPTAAPLSQGTDYADIYLQYAALRSALTDAVTQRIEQSNAALREREGDSYYMDSSYLVMTYVPFSTVYPGLVSSLTDDLTAAETELRAAFPDAVLSSTAPGVYEAVYTYVDRTSGQPVERAGRCVWERDGERGSFRVRAWIDEELVEFTQFIPQGEDLYLLYTASDLALVRYADGQITELRHVHRICEPPLGAFPGDMRPFTPESFDPFPAGAAPEELLSWGEDVQYLITLDESGAVYRGKIPQDITNSAGSRTGVRWLDIEPIDLLS